MKPLFLTGQSGKYHDWTRSSPLVETYLEQTGIFTVETVTTPPVGADMSGFSPKFTDYAAVVMVYEGAEWPDTLAADSWSSAGVSEEILATDGGLQTVLATLPAQAPSRFVRLRVIAAVASQTRAIKLGIFQPRMDAKERE